jgi:hypothetical protein
MLDFFKKAIGWIKLHSKLVCFLLGSVLVLSIAIYIATKNSKIKQLELELSILKSKMAVDKLAWQYQCSVEELNKLQATEQELQDNLYAIKQEIAKKAKELDPPMTAEEIALAFKSIGL